MGGQTALNTALSLRRMGVLEKFGVKMIGADADAIDKAEDRQLFREAMKKIGLETPKSSLANASNLKQQDRELRKDERARIRARGLAEADERKALEAFDALWNAREPERKKRYIEEGLIEALEALPEIGLPNIIRPSFTLAGTGGGIAYNKAEFIEIVER
ncbi:MAG: carbamoyl-phosphate synthase large subunit, partial [Alphaproteobacteria bacterium]|nr:carbamoyl-phosphate synthase large subunit [Alphaproteobacteria bacterium]